MPPWRWIKIRCSNVKIIAMVSSTVIWLSLLLQAVLESQSGYQGRFQGDGPLWMSRKHLAVFGDQLLKIPPYAEASHPWWELVRLIFDNTPAWCVHVTTPETLLTVQGIRTQRKQGSSPLAPPSGWDAVLKMLLVSVKYCFSLCCP